MNISDLFIRRPVLAVVVSALVVTAGVIALRDLPVRELPDVDASVVTISTRYVGASPAIVDSEITAVIEGAAAQVDGVKTIESRSREGSGRTTVVFDPAKNIDSASADLRDAVGDVAGDLPDDAGEPSVVKADSDSQPIMRLSLISVYRNPSELTDLAERVIVDRLSTVTGVGDVEINGQRRYAIRIWLDYVCTSSVTLASAMNSPRSLNTRTGEPCSIDRCFASTGLIYVYVFVAIE